FYSHQKTAKVRSKIATFTQMEGEPFHEAWERFQSLLIQCPHHHYPLALQNQFFYDGLTQTCQTIVDNAAGGAMWEKSPEETYELYEMLGANSQQKSLRSQRAGVHEINSHNELVMQVADLTKQIQLLVNKGSPSQEVCGFCGTIGHNVNSCTSTNSFAGNEPEQVNMMESYNRG